MFSAKAANAIIEHNIAINWGKADATSSYAWYTKEECELGGEYDPGVTKFTVFSFTRSVIKIVT
jgi:hypothetical protein